MTMLLNYGIQSPFPPIVPNWTFCQFFVFIILNFILKKEVPIGWRLGVKNLTKTKTKLFSHTQITGGGRRPAASDVTVSDLGRGLGGPTVT